MATITKKATKKEDRIFRETEKTYVVNGEKFTERDFKNPPPVGRRSLEYEIAYGRWADANGLTISFKTEKELDEYFNKKLYRKNHINIK